MLNHKNEIVPIRYVLAFVMVASDIEAEALPVFMMYNYDGFARQNTVDTFYQICQALEKYNITCSILGHDGDVFWKKIEHYPLSLIEVNNQHRQSPYRLLEEFELQKNDYYHQNNYQCTISVSDTKHLLKTQRCLLTYGLPLSLSNKLDNRYIDLNVIAHDLPFLDKNTLSNNNQLKMSDICALKMYQKLSVTTLMDQALLNHENETLDQKYARYRSAIYFFLMYPLVMNDVQCSCKSLQLMFITTLFVLTLHHEYINKFTKHSDGKQTKILLGSYGSFQCEVLFSKIRALCRNNNNVSNFARVYQNCLLEKQLAQETNCQIKKQPRIGNKHTNRVEVDAQLTDNDIDRLRILSETIIDIMHNNEVENIEQKFAQIHQFWYYVQNGTTEWFAHKTTDREIVQEMYTANGLNQGRVQKYTQIFKNYQILDGKVKPILPDEQKQKKTKKSITHQWKEVDKGVFIGYQIIVK
ncbi:Hypothetical_protein [Hexamita inflata]|uniref:Hypothetical_protein n=1 Tax=Hexamita inflata TaxID=28002 RepID=A0AA86Q0C8_9EUKA|nr:Hypothetical protein HINF_LOCUS32155 [Hexamita inflata]